ncbi:MAG: zinc-binding dehydrogenase [Limimaricola sp.]|uniref:NADP-dependent oxidoreductase n=1 Tax=Limimaricola sp. TaxID=2211665 RepID=UPI001D9FF6D2|nr:NADP-dependent oxidoreductase [Limimaricola sp.]MBI1417029.1 zinc-binding dehydrogenase [Limimaricola sp.]
MTTATSIVLASRPQGPATLENFRLEQHPLPDPTEGELLVRVIWLSLDPYMRGRMDDGPSYAAPVALGAVMTGGAVAEVVASRHPGFAVGDLVMGAFGWTTHAISDGAGLRKVDPRLAPPQTALGVLGMPGMTAWVGLTDIAPMKPGETVVISAATGAVGSVAGQLAKARGARVIGVAGGPEKCVWATSELGYDVCLDHHALDEKALRAALREAAPDGIDVYFENVGGKTLAAVMPNMATGGRIALCGMIAWYSGQNFDEALPLPRVWSTILTRRLNVRGFIVSDHFDRSGAFAAEVAPLVMSGRMKLRETVTDGLENAPAAFLSLLEGGNFGKALVRVGPDAGAA